MELTGTVSVGTQSPSHLLIFDKHLAAHFMGGHIGGCSEEVISTYDEMTGSEGDNAAFFKARSFIMTKKTGTRMST